MSKKSPIVAILVADVHLSLNPPVCRALEPCWFSAMARSLFQIAELSERHDAPVLCAGDLFDRWNSPPELINFALASLPDIYSIPGQHDLPLHRLDLIERSAYHTLTLTEKVKDLSSGQVVRLGGLAVQGFPWGEPLKPCEIDVPGVLAVALVHSFIWKSKKTGYPGAPEEGKLPAYKKAMEGWDVVVFGDNHKGFLTKSGETVVLNCGTVFRRRTDEVEYRPHVGLLRQSGEVELQYLDTAKDVIEAKKETDWEPNRESLKAFVEDLSRLSGDPLDFRASMAKVMRDCDYGVRGVLAAVLELSQKGN